jgi:RNA polymerase sigma-70 factor, ECF subfamily
VNRAGQIMNAMESRAATRAGPSEDLLLPALRAGEDWAYEAAAREHGPRMLAVARRLLRNDDDAQDAVQEAFLSAFKAIGSFDGASSLPTWLHRIVVNAALMRLRTRRRRERETMLADGLLPTFDETGHHTRPVRAWSDDACSHAAASETRAMVRACIDQLPESYRTVLLLRDIEEFDTAETAKMLGTTEANVKTRLHRARQALRTLLEPLMGEGN